MNLVRPIPYTRFCVLISLLLLYLFISRNNKNTFKHKRTKKSVLPFTLNRFLLFEKRLYNKNIYFICYYYSRHQKILRSFMQFPEQSL